MEIITAKEYSAFCVDGGRGKLNGYYALKKSTFELLEKFLLENNKDDADSSLEIMGLSARRGVGKIITVKNYVGIISLNDGTMIEILPKIYSGNNGDDDRKARELLVKMLNVLYNVSYKNLQTADLDVCRMNLLEVFIRMFVDEMLNLTKQGLKSNYETLENNVNCFKGKILFSKHIRRNFAHKERVYAAYDEFIVNRPENRILKSTLICLSTRTRSQKTKRDIRNLLSAFDEVEPSRNYDADFSKIVADRNTKGYTAALSWARVFLSGKSFTSFSGSTTSMALLFPMEKLFESYVAQKLKRELPTKFSVNTQDSRYHLFDQPRRFSLRPDIVITDSDGNIFVMDTKWKLLSGNPNTNYGISQSDMYQMYVYHKKYNTDGKKVQNVTLIYPQSNAQTEEICFRENGGVSVWIKFVDMLEIEKSIQDIKEKILTAV